MIYKESDLVLNVSKNINPKIWDEGSYQDFLDILCGSRLYQKDAIETSLRFLNSGEYDNLEQLAKENFDKNNVIREKFNNNFDYMKKDLDFSNKLSATVDLATGTGKSYVMIAIALIMLAFNKVDKVLILVPSITIEDELIKKFKEVISNEQLMKLLGNDFIPPEIVNGNSTITNNSIAIENRNAIYNENIKKNSIIDSLNNDGQNTLLLNDEVHHVYYSESNQWKKFISDEQKYNINFKYIMGFTGTPYKKNNKNGNADNYFSNVIYRYSLRDAIEQHFVKNVEYVSKEDMPNDKNERWQVIFNSHRRISRKLSNTLGEKPITIIVTATQSRCDSQAKKFKKFLVEHMNISKNNAEEMVLSVHSGSSAVEDRIRLKNVDIPGNPVEFIFSVSMLTEGWDVKRVFQIVPDEERAFNSKLLISQVLGRGLRKPSNWNADWGTPTVVVFNHEKWAKKVESLVNEVLDFRKKITINKSLNNDYNFNLLNLTYTTKPHEKKTLQMGSYNLWENGVNLPTDDINSTSNLLLNDIQFSVQKTLNTKYKHSTISQEDMAEILFNRFEDLDDIDLIKEYKNLWPIERIKSMISKSLKSSGNKFITKKIKNAFLLSMNILFRKGSKSVVYSIKPNNYFNVDTSDLQHETYDISLFNKNKTLLYTDDSYINLHDDESKNSFEEITNNSNHYSSFKVLNKYNFKTPQYFIVTTGKPEELFINNIIKQDVSGSIDSFIKSPDMNFYNFEYVWRKGSHQKNNNFNPDWFIKQGNTYVVVETKDDSQIINPDPENVGKNKYASKHFELINNYLKEKGSGINYKFTFLTPKNYDVFFNKLINHDIINFKSELDIVLSNK